MQDAPIKPYNEMVQKYLEHNGYSRRDFAKAYNISNRTVYRFLDGERMLGKKKCEALHLEINTQLNMLFGTNSVLKSYLSYTGTQLRKRPSRTARVVE